MPEPDKNKIQEVPPPSSEVTGKGMNHLLDRIFQVFHSSMSDLEKRALVATFFAEFIRDLSPHTDIDFKGIAARMAQDTGNDIETLLEQFTASLQLAMSELEAEALRKTLEGMGFKTIEIKTIVQLIDQLNTEPFAQGKNPKKEKILEELEKFGISVAKLSNSFDFAHILEGHTYHELREGVRHFLEPYEFQVDASKPLGTFKEVIRIPLLNRFFKPIQKGKLVVTRK